MNKITTNIHSSNVVNSTAGIMFQEVKSGFSATDDTRSSCLQTRNETFPEG